MHFRPLFYGCLFSLFVKNCRAIFMKNKISCFLFSIMLITSCVASKPYQTEKAKEALAEIDTQYAKEKIVFIKDISTYDKETNLPTLERLYVVKGTPSSSSIEKIRSYFLPKIQFFLKTFNEKYNSEIYGDTFTPCNLRLSFAFVNNHKQLVSSPNIAGIMYDQNVICYMIWDGKTSDSSQIVHMETLAEAEAHVKHQKSSING